MVLINIQMLAITLVALATIIVVYFFIFWEIGLEILRAILHMNQTQIFVLCGHSILNSLSSQDSSSTFMLEVGGGGGEEEYIILYFLSPFSLSIKLFVPFMTKLPFLTYILCLVKHAFFAL